jgi:hypothetical protein
LDLWEEPSSFGLAGQFLCEVLRGAGLTPVEDKEAHAVHVVYRYIYVCGEEMMMEERRSGWWEKQATAVWAKVKGDWLVVVLLLLLLVTLLLWVV